MLKQFYMNGQRWKVRFTYPENPVLVDRRLNKNTYTSFLMYGATSQNNGFMYIVFINAASEKRTVNFIKIADFVANRTFSGTYSDDTSTLTINASETIWGGIKLLMFKEENY